LKHYRPFCYTRNSARTLVILCLKRTVRAFPLNFASTRAALMGITASSAMGIASALANDVPAIRTCDAATGVSTTSIDPKVAIPACQEAVTSAPDNLRVLTELARAYQATKDYEKARPLFVKAADRGDPWAQSLVGAFYLTADAGFPKNDSEALRYLKLASAQRSAQAEFMLGASFYLTGRGGVKVNAVEGARLIKLAAEQGLPAAESVLGQLYEQGLGVARDEAQAIVWYGEAAAQGDKYAKAKLAELGGEVDTNAKDIKLVCNDTTFITIDPAKKYAKVQDDNAIMEFRDGASGDFITRANQAVRFFQGLGPDAKQFVLVTQNIIRFGARSDLAETEYQIDRRTAVLTPDNGPPMHCSVLPARQF
jgi:TPR repeat protein